MNTLNTPHAAANPGLQLRGLLMPCVRNAVFVALVTGVLYPLATTGVAQLLFPYQANGSLIRQGSVVTGSELICQAFSKAIYFHPRPSATTAPDPQDASKSVDSPCNASASSGSNQGPTNTALIDAVGQRAAAYREINGLAAEAPVPVDAVTASASGLDPHISLNNARQQAPRVAQARGLTLPQVQALLAQHTESRTLGLLGEARINVLRLNLALDALKAASTHP